MMNESKTGRLIEKYFEGLTTLEEEQYLREYFQKDTVPAEWEMDKAMFQFFASEREAGKAKVLPKKTTRKIYLRWASVAAAACLLLYTGVKFTLDNYQTQEISCAYIDGKTCTNPELIQLEALKTLESLSQNNKTVFAAQAEALDAFFE
ncbi:MAG: hypothetical protein LBP72_03850 [Dysgonamonadaceae bacterium]|jgi:hypothetical protein|nr:hypothetical protein [Dysgonamonadaceae bacterium]